MQKPIASHKANKKDEIHMGDVAKGWDGDLNGLIESLIPVAKKYAKRASYRYGLDRDEVEQEAMMGVIAAAQNPSILQMEYPRTYLMTYLRRGTRKQIEFERKTGKHSLDGIDLPDDTPPHDPFAMGTVIKASTGVSAADLELLVRVYCKEEQMTEVAEALGVSKQAVFKRRNRALNKMRENLGV